MFVHIIALAVNLFLLKTVDGQMTSITFDELTEAPTLETESEAGLTKHALVRDFFLRREIRSVILVTCSQTETMKLSRILQSGSPTIQCNLDGELSERGDHQLHGVFANLGCDSGMLAVRNEIEGSVPWLIWDLDDSSGLVPEDLNLAINSDVTIVRARPGDSVELMEVYKVHALDSPRVRSIGLWRPHLGLILPPRRVLDLRGDLEATGFRAAVVLHQIAVDGDQDSLRGALVDHSNTHMDTETRFGFALANHLAEMYNFTLELLVTPSWGYMQSNGSFDGMIGMLQRGDIQLGITPAVITKDRLGVADFSVQTWTLRTCFIFRHPRLLVPYKALAKPFDVWTWLGVALVAVLSVSVLAAVRHCERSGASTGGGGAVVEAATVVVGLLSQQGSAVDSGLVSGRAVLLVGLLLSVLLQSFYTSAIVTSLLTPIPRTIRTARDLMRSPLQVGLEDYSYNRAVFPKSADSLTTSLYRNKILASWPDGGFFSVEDGVARVRRGGFAFYSEDSSLYTPIQNTFSDDEKCSLSEVELNPAFVTAAPLAKRSPYKELFNRG